MGETKKQAENQPCTIHGVGNSIFLQTGMKVKIKNDTKNYIFNAGKIKTITRILPDFGKNRAFALDWDDGIWCIEDFEYCVNYPNLSMR
jgi:hypothetical protein